MNKSNIERVKHRKLLTLFKLDPGSKGFNVSGKRFCKLCLKLFGLSYAFALNSCTFIKTLIHYKLYPYFRCMNKTSHTSKDH